MGWPKAWLPFGPELMLPRVVRLLGEVVAPLVVVAAPDQALPNLPDTITIVRDRDQGRGPLEGLRAGLAALSGLADAAFATSCDVPLLAPGFVRRVIELFPAGEYDIAVPWAEGYHHPLAAVYRVQVVAQIERLLEENRLRPVFLFEQVRTRVISAAELEDVDPQLNSLRNLNHPSDYYAALAAAGYSPSPEIQAVFGPPPF